MSKEIPPVLTHGDFCDLLIKYENDELAFDDLIEAIAKAQRDADVLYYEAKIAEAIKEERERIRDIFDEIFKPPLPDYIEREKLVVLWFKLRQALQGAQE